MGTLNLCGDSESVGSSAARTVRSVIASDTWMTHSISKPDLVMRDANNRENSLNCLLRRRMNRKRQFLQESARMWPIVRRIRHASTPGYAQLRSVSVPLRPVLPYCACNEQWLDSEESGDRPCSLQIPMGCCQEDVP